jgi:hypothetical protein
MTAFVPPQTLAAPADEGARLRRAWPAEWKDGARSAFLMRFDGVREPGGYPRGFHRWPLHRRNAWYCAFNKGFRDRIRLAQGKAR